MKSSMWTILVTMVAIIISLGYWAGCADKEPEAGNPVGPKGQQAAGLSSEQTFDDLLAEIARRVPGFGGVYIGSTGALEIVLVDASQATAARDAIASVFGQESVPEGAAVVRKGRYDFLQLKTWHDLVTSEILGMKGVVYNDVDEQANKLSIGIEDAGVRSAIESKLATLGIQREAVVIKITDPVTVETNLQNFHRPLRGGLQEQFIGRVGNDVTAPITTGTFSCTMGFIANRAGIRGYVTNSHCTFDQGGVQNTSEFQPTTVLASRVGIETVDPAYVAGGVCPAGRRCRRSDAAFIRVPHTSGPSPVASNLGQIARTPLGGAAPCAWNGADFFSILGAQNPIFMGETVNKTGRTTCRTSGVVNATCSNFNVNNTNNSVTNNITQLCQGRATYLSAGGDSGSPVYRVVNAGGNTVALMGIHWGSGGVFSPIANIMLAAELGALTIR